MINLNWLNTFCVLVEQKHFTATASKLFMTQSGVSQHIKKLEQQLDIELILREGKSFSLTEAGQKLYRQGGELLRSFGELEEQVKQDSPYNGKVHICSPGSVGLQLYPFLLELQVEHKGLSIDHRFAPNKEVIARILNRSADLGLSTETYGSEKVISSAISKEPLVLVTHNSVAKVTWAKLVELGIIAHPDVGHHCRMLLSENFEEFEGVEQFQQNGFSNQIGLILEPVRLGLGFTILPLHAVSAFRANQDIKVHHLPVQVSETLYLSCHKSSVLSARIDYIRTEIVNFLQKLT